MAPHVEVHPAEGRMGQGMDARVLLTGATGYIGGSLLRHFEEANRPVRCLARNPERVQATRSMTEVVEGDCLDEASLDFALAGVDSAYYLVHSMSVGADFAEVDRHAAANFGRAAARAGVRRIIYLGGLSVRRVRSPAISRVEPKPDPSCAPVAFRSSSSEHRS